MGLFDLLRRAAPQPEPPPIPATADRRFHGERARMFDLARTGELAALFAEPRDQRRAEWCARFWDAAWCASAELASPDTFAGPDGFPYLRLNLPRDGPFDSQCLANVARDCLKAGVGAAFFASPDEPAEASHFVLSMGLIDSLVRYDSPDGDPVDLGEAASGPDTDFDFNQPLRQQAQEAREVLVGTPSRDYLPPYAAAALSRYLERVWGLQDPRVQILVDMSARPHRSLVIGRKRSEFPEGLPIDDMARAATWYLTPGRSLMLMPEDWRLKDMTPLRDLT